MSKVTVLPTHHGPPIEVGQVLPTWRVDAVDAQRMKVLALLLHDPNPIHFDVEAARRSGAPALVNQGPSNMAMLANAVHQAFPDGRITGMRVRLTGRVLAGQAAEVVGEVSAVNARDNHVVVTCTVRLVAEGASALEGETDIAITMKKDGGAE